MDDKDLYTNLLNRVFERWGDRSFLEWKYYNNPFGFPIVETAIINDEIRSLRFFMPWKMINNGNVYDCYQATDSATRKEFRGKGYFTSLTRKSLGHLKEKEFVFNFPNENSVNIYLKLGWKLESSDRPTYIPLINFYKNTKHYLLDSFSTLWDGDSLSWRLNNGKEYFRYGGNDLSFVYRKVHLKGIKVADIVWSDPDINHNEVKAFNQYLLKNNFLFIRYIGFNTKFNDIINNGFYFKFKAGRLVNLVSYGKPKELPIRAEMLDSDYI